MLKRSLVDLRELTQEQKEATWKETISGSQAWMLVNEPYNLLRDKLGVERIHKSKYDFLDKSKKGKAISNNAMHQGTMFEPVIANIIKDEIDNNFIYENHTLQLHLFMDNGNKLDMCKITSTPDLYIKGEKGNTYKLIADIKCSTSAANEEVMMERYYYQALHNCYVTNCKDFVFFCKNEITGPLYTYQLSFTDEDFEQWEQKILEFFTNLIMQNETAYDNLYVEQKTSKTKDIELKEPIIRDADVNEAAVLENLILLKQQQAEIKSQIEAIEKVYKDNFDDITINFNGKTFNQKASVVVGNIDYATAMKEISTKYNFPKTEFDAYRKPYTIKKLITFKQGK